jgi:tetratricopeptide (TPR) repeat protein
MAVDLYSLCPCGSGKKLKFCCGDLAAEIDKAYRMIEGDQPRAALRHVEQTLAKAPGRASLLDLKAVLELSLGEHANAAKTIDELIRVDPENPSAHAQGAILASELGDPRGSVERLQDALERVADSIPVRVLEAVGSVGQGLLSDGNLVAARAHLWLYQGIAGREDTRAMQLLVRLNQVSRLPLLLRDHLYLRELPLGHEAEQRHDHAQLLASRGQWRRAAAEFDALTAAFPGVPVLTYNAALVHAWLGHLEEFVAGLRAFAGASGVDRDDAIEAEAIAQLLDPAAALSQDEVTCTSIAVVNEELLVDRLSREPRFEAYPMDESELAAISGPPPRHTHVLYDRAAPAAAEDLDLDAVPIVLGVLAYYGRQTDRPERLELVADCAKDKEAGLAAVRELVGEALGEVLEERVLGAAPGGPSGLHRRMQFPKGTPPATRKRLVAEERRRLVVERWPATPSIAFAGKTPVEAAADPSLALALAAAVMNLEQAAGDGADHEAFAALRAKLGLATPTPIDPRAIDLETLPLARLPRIDLASATDDELVSLYERAVLAGAPEAILTIARVAIERPPLSDRMTHEELYYRLVSHTTDQPEALRWLERARNDAEASGKSTATWDILELELRVVAGELDEANRLVRHLRDEHLSEPGIAEQLYQLLYAFGALPPPESYVGQQQGGGAGGEFDAGFAPEPAAAGAASSKLWTPGEPAEGSAGGGSKKIWTPT